MQINLINYLTEEEIKAMPLVDLEVTKTTITSKTTNVHRDTYQAVVKFDRLSSFKLNTDEKGFLDEFTISPESSTSATNSPSGPTSASSRPNGPRKTAGKRIAPTA